jgi:hypothetical protein
MSVACAAALVVGTVSLGAQAADAPRSTNTTAQAAPFSMRPFGRIFDRAARRPAPPAPPAAPLWRVSPRPAIAPEHRCSLIRIPAGPLVVPQFEKRLPQRLGDDQRTAAMRCD